MSDFKILIQLCTDSQERHTALIRHIERLLKDIDGIAIEVVAHGKGIGFLFKGNVCAHDIIALSKKGVRFHACEATLAMKAIARETILEEAIFIPHAITYIVVRQHSGWPYIRA
ncbi:MAG: hypothetical protein ACRDDZ_02190 [Marinifilaceae bacterium]